MSVQRFDTRGGRHVATPPVLIVSLTTCGYCAEAKAFFAKRGITPAVIEFDRVGPDLRRKIAADMRKHGVKGFPFVMIGGRAVRGFYPERFDQLLSMN
jgi:glutaredoxin